MRAKKPEPVIKSAMLKHKQYASNDSINRMLKCPAVIDEMRNLFLIKSIYDYELTISDDCSINSTMYNQSFFDDHVIIRDAQAGFVSFTQPYIFFTDAKSLEISWMIPPYLEDNHITRSVYSFPGRFDIGKWFRTLDFPFFFRDGINQMLISEGDVYSYLKFHTNEKINFIKFMPTDRIKFFSDSCIRSTRGRKYGFNKIKDYYSTFNTKKYILQEIKNSVLTK